MRQILVKFSRITKNEHEKLINLFYWLDAKNNLYSGWLIFNCDQEYYLSKQSSAS